jgi:rhamnose utilization protein RhaD (predicted bifunctional aldolase and dehydrogenase)
MNQPTILSELLQLSHHIGEPANDYVIQAEGNTSARIDDQTFWIKASGYPLYQSTSASFIAMRFQPLLELLDGSALDEPALKAAFNTAKADPSVNLRPSVEVVLHALALTLGGAKYVAHTHPAAWNAILCSAKAEEAVLGRLFPDQVVLCGPAPVYIKYTDPGIPLAQEVQRQFRRYIDQYGEPPKEILLLNHGLIALGNSIMEVENITAMSVKAARVLLGTYALGGPNFLSQNDVFHLWRRPDEILRRARLS